MHLSKDVRFSETKRSSVRVPVVPVLRANEMKKPTDVISERIESLTSYLENSPRACELSQQRHLDSGTPEQAYWHAGYRTALIDALRLVLGAQILAHTTDNEDGCPLDARDEKSFH